MEAFALRSLGFLEWRAGNWDEADRHVAGALELLTQLGRVDPPAEFPAAIIAAHRGRIDEARARRKRRGGPGRGRADPDRAVRPRLGARLHRALAG